MGVFNKLLATHAPCSTALIRLIVGGTFLSEGIQKFLFPDPLGVGRFVKIGIPYSCTFAKNRGCETLGKWVFPNCGLNWCMSGQ